MIYKVYPSLNDFENLSRLKVESSEFANDFDYRNIVVNKPWGYEYLWYQNQFVAIWFLRITPGQSTSLHCHAKKRTSLIVLDGSVTCTTIDDKYQLNALEAVVLEPCVFHSSSTNTDQGAYLMEIETPPMKGDLVRMHDVYGRQNIGYEKTNEYSKDLSLYEFHPFDDACNETWKFNNLEISLISNSLKPIKDYEMIVPINGVCKSATNEIIDIGEAVQMNSDFFANQENKEFNNQFFVFKKFD
ncbi:MAG: hypothetical protein WCH59_01380 [Chitinophagia bacterium]|jgi:mannose-6-phosphate isomerase-like protein (cupin superfamily)